MSALKQQVNAPSGLLGRTLRCLLNFSNTLLGQSRDGSGSMNMRMVVAVLLPFLALGLQWVLWPWIDPLVWFLFFPTVFFSARLGGFWGGLISTALSTGIVWYFFLLPQLSWKVDHPTNFFSVYLFLVMGYLFSDVQERLRRSLQASKIALDRTLADNANYVGKFNDSESRFEATFEQAAMGIALVAPDGRWLRVNRKLCDIIGYGQDELLAKSFQEITHPDDLLTDLAYMRQLLSGEIPNYSMEKRYLKKNGGITWINLTVSLVRKPDTTPDYFIAVIEDIQDRKHIETTLKASELSLKDAQQLANVGNWSWDIKTNKHIWSDEVYRIYGRDPALPPAVYPEVQQYFTPASWARLSAAVDKGLASGTPYECDAEVIHADGTHHWIVAHGESLQDAAGNIIQMHGTIQDITQRKQSEEQLRVAAAAFESQEGMMITDTNNTILRVNHAFTNITGYTAEEAIGKNPRIFHSGHQDENFYVAMWERLKSNGAWEGELWNRRKNGEVYPEHLSITSVKHQDGNVLNYVAAFTDITQRKKAEEDVKRLAYFDALTGLPNRRLLQDRLQRALAASTRNGKQGALMFIDLDDFKSLNDTLGHAIGDLLLQQVAQRLATCTREGDTIARLGGDEFVIILEGLSERSFDAAAQTELVGMKILTALCQPYHLDTHQCHSTPSIGVTLFKGQQQEIDELLKQADIAMYQAKKSGRSVLRFFDPKMQDNVNIRVDLESELRKALEGRQFQLYYQIQVDSSGHPFGAEALIRWIHPTRGMVSPVQFIPLAEETGLILPIGLWVLETACAQLKKWQHAALTRKLILSVNISAKQFRQADFVAQVQNAIRYHAIDPQFLKLELTESMLLEDIEETIATMVELSKSGVRLSLDDFGTGYSCLQYLKRLPLDQLKIDQSFVHDIATDKSDKAIVRTIIAMAKSLELDVIAEGVETEEQRQLLLHKGCTHYQGYLFGRPVPIDQFEILLKQSGVK